MFAIAGSDVMLSNITRTVDITLHYIQFVRNQKRKWDRVLWWDLELAVMKLCVLLPVS
jgi:hypothetical protein